MRKKDPFELMLRPSGKQKPLKNHRKINKNQKDEKSVSESVLVSKMCLLGTNFGTKTASKTIKKNDQKKYRFLIENGRPWTLKPEQLKTESAA